jgi:hypothetical protein
MDWIYGVGVVVLVTVWGYRMEKSIKETVYDATTEAIKNYFAPED